MTISFPLSLPSVGGIRQITFRPLSMVGLSESPFTFEQQAYVHQGERWAADVVLSGMNRANAEEWIGFLLALNGREGYFLLGDPAGTAARGTWAGGSPLVNGAGQTGKTLAVDGLSAGATTKAGDWLQLGSGSSARLHKISQGGTANGSGQLTLDIWPRLRASPADNDAVTIASPQGVFRLASNERAWTIEDLRYGMSFSCVEKL